MKDLLNNIRNASREQLLINRSEARKVEERRKSVINELLKSSDEYKLGVEWLDALTGIIAGDRDPFDVESEFDSKIQALLAAGSGSTLIDQIKQQLPQITNLGRLAAFKSSIEDELRAAESLREDDDADAEDDIIKGTKGKTTSPDDAEIGADPGNTLVDDDESLNEISVMSLIKGFKKGTSGQAARVTRLTGREARVLGACMEMVQVRVDAYNQIRKVAEKYKVDFDGLKSKLMNLANLGESLNEAADYWLVSMDRSTIGPKTKYWDISPAVDALLEILKDLGYYKYTEKDIFNVGYDDISIGTKSRAEASQLVKDLNKKLPPASPGYKREYMVKHNAVARHYNDPDYEDPADDHEDNIIESFDESHFQPGDKVKYGDKDATIISSTGEGESEIYTIEIDGQEIEAKPDELTKSESRIRENQKIDQRSLTQIVLRDGFIPIDNGKNRFVVTQINDKNFTDINDKLRTQLEEEGKWNYWIGFIWWKDSDRYSIRALPIYGSSNRYVTKWFTKTPEETIRQNLMDKDLQLLKRVSKTECFKVESVEVGKIYDMDWDGPSKVKVSKINPDGTCSVYRVNKYGERLPGIKNQADDVEFSELTKSESRIRENQKIDQRTFIQKVLQDGFIPLDKGSNRFVVAQINDKNFTDISDKLRTQLEEEGKWNYWIGFIWWKDSDRYSIRALPIYGSSNRYVTKWFTKTPEDAIRQSLSDKDMKLLQRVSKTECFKVESLQLRPGIARMLAGKSAF